MRFVTIGIMLITVSCTTSDSPDSTSSADVRSSDTLAPSSDLLRTPIDIPEPSCAPSKTCADYPNQCGSALYDGCVGTLDCRGACLPPNVCLPDETCGTTSQCVPDCAIAECGSDGCGGTCGLCGDAATCIDGQCTSNCIANCDGKNCGTDGCDGSCGTCAAGSTCIDGLCIEDCSADCIGKICGDDGCGGTCGECDADTICISGTCEIPPSGLVVANEILFDPPDDAAGDANCDGVRDASDDEFVEIVNDALTSVDLSGATLSDSVSIRHTFADGTIVGPKGIIVIFGGGTPTFDGTGPGAWCHAIPSSVYMDVASSGSLGLNNGGDTVTLTLADGTEVFSVLVDPLLTNLDQSVARSPELTGGWAVHGDIADSIGNFSPATRANGLSF